MTAVGPRLIVSYVKPWMVRASAISIGVTCAGDQVAVRWNNLAGGLCQSIEHDDQDRTAGHVLTSGAAPFR